VAGTTTGLMRRHTPMRFFGSWWERMRRRALAPGAVVALGLGLGLGHAHSIANIVGPGTSYWG
jgi:hypothetical protein